MLSTMAVQTNGPSAKHSHTRSFQIGCTSHTRKDECHAKQEHPGKHERVDGGAQFRNFMTLASTLRTEPDQQHKSCNHRDADPHHGQFSPRARMPPKMNSNMSAIKPKA